MIALGILAISAAAASPSSTMRVSVSSGGGQGDRDSFAAGISADGRYVLVNSLARSLVPGDTNDSSDVFVHNRMTGTTTRTSVSSAAHRPGAAREPEG